MKILNEILFHNTTLVLGTFYSIGNRQKKINELWWRIGNWQSLNCAYFVSVFRIKIAYCPLPIPER